MKEKPAIGVDVAEVLRNSSDPLFLVNAHQRIVFFNRACEELTGHKQEQVLGLECRQHGPLESGDLASLAGSLCPPVETLSGQPAVTQTLLLHPNGERLWRTIHFIPWTGTDGTISVILGRISAPHEQVAPAEVPEPLSRLYARMRKQLYEGYGFDHVVAVSPAMQRVLDQVQLASQSSAPVLLQGEKGTGKEHLARTIHYQSARRQQSFVTLDCAALPPAFLEQRLFGGQAAAVFHAQASLLADPGVAAVYLREPAKLPRDLQARLVEFLDAATPQAPRLTAGSTADLAQSCREERFLEALYYRLSTLAIDVPPVRDRGPDLPLLVQQILERCNAASEKQVRGLQPAAWEFVHAYRWPGNVTELHAVLAQAHAHATGPEIALGDFPVRLQNAVELAQMPAAPPLRPLPLDKLLLETERRLLELALRQAKGNKSKAATRLEISRARLIRRLQQLGITQAKPGVETELANEDVSGEDVVP